MPAKGTTLKVGMIEAHTMKIDPVQMGKLMRAGRIKRGETIVQAARRANVDRATIHNWETKGVPPNFCRMLNYLLSDETNINELWRIRALAAESALKDISDAIKEWKYALPERTRGNLL